MRVPDTEVAKTTGVKRYGALAGKVMPAPIWNDIRQLNNRTKPFGDKFDQLLRLWKMNKTVFGTVVSSSLTKRQTGSGAVSPTTCLSTPMASVSCTKPLPS